MRYPLLNSVSIVLILSAQLESADSATKLLDYEEDHFILFQVVSCLLQEFYLLHLCANFISKYNEGLEIRSLV